MFWGGLKEGVRGRQADCKATIVPAAQENGTGIARIRTDSIVGISAESLTALIEESIEPGGVVRTDGWAGYAAFNEQDHR